MQGLVSNEPQVSLICHNGVRQWSIYSLAFSWNNHRRGRNFLVDIAKDTA